jgi:hypothetical protein
MKFTKRMLAAFLTFARALGLALPTMAAVDWNQFNFNKHPENKTINHGDGFTLCVDVNEPDGATVEYQWYYRSYLSDTGLIENATSRELYLEPDSPYYPGSSKLGGTWAEYQCEITAYEKDNEGDSHIVRSIYARVTRTRTFQEKLYSVTLEPWTQAFGYAATSFALSWVTLLPVIPILFLGALIYFYGKNFIALF